MKGVGCTLGRVGITESYFKTSWYGIARFLMENLNFVAKLNINLIKK